MDDGEFVSPIVARRLKRRRNVVESTPEESQRPRTAASPDEACEITSDSSPPAKSPHAKRVARVPRQKIRGFGHPIFDVEARTGKRRRPGRGLAGDSASEDGLGDTGDEGTDGEGCASGDDGDEDGGGEDLDADLEGFVVPDDCGNSQLYRSSAPESESCSGGSSSEADPYLASLLSQAPVHFGKRQPIQSKFTTKAGMYSKGRFHMKWDVKAENHLHLDGLEEEEEEGEDDGDADGAVHGGPDTSSDAYEAAYVGDVSFDEQPRDDWADSREEFQGTAGDEGDPAVGRFPILSRIIMPLGGNYESEYCSLQFDRILKLVGKV